MKQLLVGAMALLLLGACKPQAPATGPGGAADAGRRFAQVDAARIHAPAPGEWPAHGRNYAEQRYSPLDRIHAGNVGQLGLAWHYKLDVDRGTEATPIVVDGTMFVTGAWSIVYALDAKTGALKWRYDPEVDRSIAGRGCCDVVNRGVAVWKGKVYLGAFDGRLIALDAASGERLWQVQTVDADRNYTITGAPRVVKGKVLIGNGGAELGVRGYISAYDAETGAMAWRFWTVPGNPEDGFESPALERAAKTWHGNWWEQGGGGTVWDSMAYDPELDLLYIGTGNGSPWNIKYRSDGRGDNLYLSSIVALRPDTGEYVWHYQTTPGDAWDYTATQHIILADLKLDGETRKVLMQAPKNGFFYVLDRTNGKLISADNFVPVNWADGIDPDTGRPNFTPTSDYGEQPQLITPGPLGAHNWQPMSFNPQTGLVYIPAQHTFLVYEDLGQRPQMALNAWNVGLAPFKAPEDPDELRALSQQFGGELIAWDPVAQEKRWSVPYEAPWNGGTLSTAGKLVFQGSADGRLLAYAADSGKLLWEARANTGVMAGPISYAIDGEQYIAVAAGWGGAFPLVVSGFEPDLKVAAEARVLVFKLGGKAQLPPPVHEALPVPEPPPVQVGDEQIEIGRQLYNGYCAMCHGVSAVSGSVTPDLRYMDAETHAQFEAIVAGARAQRGMPAFAHLLPPAYVGLIHEYLKFRGRQLYDRVQAQRAEAGDDQGE